MRQLNGLFWMVLCIFYASIPTQAQNNTNAQASQAAEWQQMAQSEIQAFQKAPQEQLQRYKQNVLEWWSGNNSQEPRQIRQAPKQSKQGNQNGEYNNNNNRRQGNDGYNNNNDNNRRRGRCGNRNGNQRASGDGAGNGDWRGERPNRKSGNGSNDKVIVLRRSGNNSPSTTTPSTSNGNRRVVVVKPSGGESKVKINTKQPTSKTSTSTSSDGKQLRRSSN